MDGADSNEPDRTMTEVQKLLHGLPQDVVGGCAFLHIFEKVQYHQLQ